jgi:hypothetical protein
VTSSRSASSDKFNALPSDDAKLCFVYCLARLMRAAEIKGPGSERGRSLPGPRVTEWDYYSVPQNGEARLVPVEN